MLVLGGGGYTLRNVPRCWAYETALLLDTPVKGTLPYNVYFEYYGPDYSRHLPVSNMQNLNTPKYLEDIKLQVLQVLDGVDATSAPILTGQVGTTQTPASLQEISSGKGSSEGNPDVRSKTDGDKMAVDVHR